MKYPLCGDCPGGFDVLRKEVYDLETALTEMAEAVLSLAEDAGMPDTYKESDSRMTAARKVLKGDS